MVFYDTHILFYTFWDYTAAFHQVFRVPGNDGDAEFSELPWALARPQNKANSKSDPRRNVNLKYRVDELNEPPPRLSGIRSLLPLPGGDLLTGGTDLKIRRWDHSRWYNTFSNVICHYSYLLLTFVVIADLSEVTVCVGQQLRAWEMMNSMKVNLALVCRSCRYLQCSLCIAFELLFR